MNWKNLKNRPLFVGGHRKAGTTLLVSLLDGHEDLFVYPGETAFFYKFFPVFDTDRFSPEEKTAQLTEMLTEMLQGKRGLTGSPLPASIGAEQACGQFLDLVQGHEMNSHTLYDAFYQTLWSALGQSRGEAKLWVEKTTSIEIYTDTLFDWYPEARFIHLLRDPRDNYAAIKSGWESSYRFQFDSMERLLQSVLDRALLGMKLADQNQKRYGKERYQILKYEDLVRDPRAIMEEICSFLNIPFSETLLRPTLLGESWKGNSYGGKPFRGISSDHVGRWAERISDHEAKVLEFHFGELLDRYGYARRFEAAETSRAAADHYKWFNYAQSYSLKMPEPAGEKDRV